MPHLFLFPVPLGAEGPQAGSFVVLLSIGQNERANARAREDEEDEEDEEKKRKEKKRWRRLSFVFPQTYMMPVCESELREAQCLAAAQR